VSGIPRTEAVSIVGSLLSYPPVVAQLPLLLPDAAHLTLVSSQELQVTIVESLLSYPPVVAQLPLLLLMQLI
jgi:hypothetical protein